MILLWVQVIQAEELLSRHKQRQILRNHLNMRMGISTATSNGQPTICLEGSPLENIAIEACGTGYGFVHRALGTDFVHFRGKWSLLRRKEAHYHLVGQLGFGFAEIQIGADELGFQFTNAEGGVETAGPEISASMQWLHTLPSNTELVFDINIGSAFFYYGPELVIAQPPLFPFMEMSIGLGW